MFLHQLSPGAVATINHAAQAAGTTDTTTGTQIDMLGYEGVMFILGVGTLTDTGVLTLTAKNSDVSNTYGAGTIDTLLHPITGLTVQGVATTGDSNTLVGIDIYRPPSRYVRAQWSRATANVVVSLVIAIQYNPQTGAATQLAVAPGYAAAGYQLTSNPTRSLV